MSARVSDARESGARGDARRSIGGIRKHERGAAWLALIGGGGGDGVRWGECAGWRRRGSRSAGECGGASGGGVGRAALGADGLGLVVAFEVVAAGGAELWGGPSWEGEDDEAHEGDEGGVGPEHVGEDDEVGLLAEVDGDSPVEEADEGDAGDSEDDPEEAAPLPPVLGAQVPDGERVEDEDEHSEMLSRGAQGGFMMRVGRGGGRGRGAGRGGGRGGRVMGYGRVARLYSGA